MRRVVRMRQRWLGPLLVTIVRVRGEKLGIGLSHFSSRAERSIYYAKKVIDR